MGIFKVKPQTRGPRGEGRTKIYKPLQLPEEVISDLKTYQSLYSIRLAEKMDEYGNPIPVHITLEQMLYRWMDNVGKFDKAVYKDFKAIKKDRINNPPAPTYPVDPLDCPVWDLQYIAERDGEELVLQPDKELYFFAIVEGEKVGIEQLVNDEWEFMNDAGIDITLEQGKVISKRILNHQKKIANQRNKPK